MKLLATALLATLLAGCSLLTVPSFWDPNQARMAVDIRYAVADLDCDTITKQNVFEIDRKIEWFELYSESSGWRHQDMLDLVAPLAETVDDFAARAETSESINPVYCNLKKQNMQLQSERFAEAVLGRKLETTGHEVLKAVHPHPTMSEAVMESVADAYDEVIHL
mgnify:CR=1 FL=1